MRDLKLIICTFILCMLIIPVGASAETVTVGSKSVEVVTAGDGLYKDAYVEGRYVYKGADPDNYITFNNEKWRIISVEADGSLKIIRNTAIKLKAWDSTTCTTSDDEAGCNEWTRPADINTYLNGDYYNSLTDKDKVLSHAFGIGDATYQNTDLSSQITTENATTWTGKVGLMSVSDYLRANTNTEQCGTYKLNNTNYSTCVKTNWLYTSTNQWTISLSSTDKAYVNYICSSGYIKAVSSQEMYNVYPVVYISSNYTPTTSNETTTTTDDPTPEPDDEDTEVVDVPSTAASALIFTTVGVALMVIAGIVIYTLVRTNKVEKAN